jgi:short chain dehydrogenase
MNPRARADGKKVATAGSRCGVQRGFESRRSRILPAVPAVSSRRPVKSGRNEGWGWTAATRFCRRLGKRRGTADIAQSVIVGGSTGIGLTLAQRLAARGEDVVVTSRDAATAEGVARELGPSA